MSIPNFMNKKKEDKLLAKAKECIYRHGTLRYCRSKVCACVGCVNSVMSEEEYYQALGMEEIQSLLNQNKQVEVGNGLTWVFKG